MKKFFLSLGTIFSLLLTGCKGQEIPTLLVPAGSPLISVAGILDQVDYEVTIGPSLLPSELIKGEKDVIVAPVIIGAKLFNLGSSDYQLAAIIGFSNLYIASRSKLNALEDLNGKKMLAFGETATPGIVLKQLTQDIDIEIEWGNDIKEMIGPFKTKRHDYVLISEPALTTLKNSLEEEIYTLPLKDYFTGLIVQVGVFLNPHSKHELDALLVSLQDNIAYLNLHPEDYAAQVVNIHSQLSEFGEETIAKSIQNLDLDYQTAIDNRTDIEGFLNILNTYNPELLANQLPSDNFYYEAQ